MANALRRRRCSPLCWVIAVISVVVVWRRPTLPHLEVKYHGRWGVSRPCSGWERVLQPRDGHQTTAAEIGLWWGDWGLVCGCDVLRRMVLRAVIH